jgi:hypothetical protein
MYGKIIFLSFLLIVLLPCFVNGADNNAAYWHGIKRELRYQPEGDGFSIVNGDKRFSRAVYGTNSDFRFETSDYPEVGLYMPNFGGSMYFAVSTKDTVIWVKDMQRVHSYFESGIRIWSINDISILGSGSIKISVLALSDGDGLIIKVKTDKIKKDVMLNCIFGGANDKRFSRSGDIGADPINSFYIEPEKCRGNIYRINGNEFNLEYGKNKKTIKGIYPPGSSLNLKDAGFISDLTSLLKSKVSDLPVIVSTIDLKQGEFNILLSNPLQNIDVEYSDLDKKYQDGDIFRKNISGRVKVNTPDPFLNTLGGVLAGAEDAIWESPSYLHGAIGWRMPLTGWRGAYVADVFGFHDKARLHFDAYAASQVKNVPVVYPHLQDPASNLARSEKKWGTPMYSNGYICRNPNSTKDMHHYDMNLVYIDQLLSHLNWTGDIDYAKKVFPVIKSHLAWEKNTFDPDDDGLYDGYCCIWASDGLQYNGGVATHSSAYNYRANLLAGQIAEKIGEDGSIYKSEASKILKAINDNLWLKNKGWWAEFKDNMGYKKVHENAAVWTIYHAIDSKIHDPFKAYQATKYIDNNIPHIPVLAEGLKDTSNYVVSTSDWQPYVWSINNVAFAEVAHTALAYWQSGRPAEAYKLFKGALLDAMYLGSGPGNITQVSFYDAARGETYRDFADPVACAARDLVQGLFGINPDLMNDELIVQPGFPSDWDHASLQTANFSFSFKRKGNSDSYFICPKLKKDANLILKLNAGREKIVRILVNGKEAGFRIEEYSVDRPVIIIEAGKNKEYNIEVVWGGNSLDLEKKTVHVTSKDVNYINTPLNSTEMYDPQRALIIKEYQKSYIEAFIKGEKGNKTVFFKVSQGDMSWWKPMEIVIHDIVEVENDYNSNSLDFKLKTSIEGGIVARLNINEDTVNTDIFNMPSNVYKNNYISDNLSGFGTNKLHIKTYFNYDTIINVTNWNLMNPIGTVYDKVNLSPYFNDKVSNIFEFGKYVSPRWKYTTLSVPTQGMGSWTHPEAISKIDDTGLRKLAGNSNTITLPQGVPFATPGDSAKNNIVFTTLWDNYPDSVSVPLNGKASKVYFLLAASTYHMQFDFLNGRIKVYYTDGTCDKLDLKLPETLLPLDQDIYTDGYAFRINAPRPFRINLKTGEINTVHRKVTGVSMSNEPLTVDGGLATIMDLPLNSKKELKSLVVETTANEVVIGLIAATLVRDNNDSTKKIPFK